MNIYYLTLCLLFRLINSQECEISLLNGEEVTQLQHDYLCTNMQMHAHMLHENHGNKCLTQRQQEYLLSVADV
jgi:hypothetical protein